MPDDSQPKKTPAEALAEALARKAGLAEGGPGVGAKGWRSSERAAAARSASKSKPALRK